jgi:hypothetical protein
MITNPDARTYFSAKIPEFMPVISGSGELVAMKALFWV